MTDLTALPEGLPIPVDDGACAHLTGMRLPEIILSSTSGRWVELGSLPDRTVIYCYPLTGRPDRSLPQDWDEIPGARGCTPQSCAFRDHFQELKGLGAEVFGLSTQPTDYQLEAVERLHLPYELLSDASLVFANAMGLPTFKADSMTLLKRLTLIISEGVVEKVFYPVFPPGRNAADVVEWLHHH